MIATYQDLEGGSGIVFDASLARFTNKAYQVEDNKRYIENISKWLTQNSFGNPAKNILIYNTYNSIRKFFSFDKMGGLKVAESAGRIRDFAFA